MDRLVVSGSYFLFRCFIDLAPKYALEMMFDSALGWISHNDIHNLKSVLGISKMRHPTSGCLAIDWFVRHRPDPSIPVYIHGFDFFQGPRIHYYSKTEPLYERLNDLLGVTVMHEPTKERAFVQRLVQEGKVKWLAPKESSEGNQSPASEQNQKKGDSDVWTYCWGCIVTANRMLTILTYPIAAPFICCSQCPPLPENARFFYLALLSFWIPASGTFYVKMWSVTWGLPTKLVTHFLWFWAIDVALVWSLTSLFLTEYVLKRKECTNRLFSDKKPEFHGSKIVVLGNGPSLAKGDPYSKFIDSMDEVVRFNNFQAKGADLEAWTGTKTTVHFSDSMLYPSYPEYAVPGSCVVLSLFMDRLMISISYFCFRMGIDLAVRSALNLMLSPGLGWIPHDDIVALKNKIGISKWKHPTSGCLAIDWMVRHRPDPSVPIYIHGFDFFQGTDIHYYSRTEPLYERLNDLLGVTMMHEPEKEKAFVEQLVSEGKVMWLSKHAAKK
jgi:hypothetical protein